MELIPIEVKRVIRCPRLGVVKEMDADRCEGVMVMGYALPKCYYYKGEEGGEILCTYDGKLNPV